MSYRVLSKQEIEPEFYEHYCGIIPKGGLTMIAGQGGSGKSTFLCWLAEYLSREGKTIIVSNEEDASIISSRLSENANVDIASFSENYEAMKIELSDLFELIDAYDIVLIDSLVTFNEGKDINKAGTAEAFLFPFIAKVVGTNKAVVFLHHTNKGGGNTLQDMVSGSERLVSGVRNCRILINDKMHNRRFFAFSKDNTGLEEIHYEIISKEKETKNGAKVWIVDRLVETNEDMDKIAYMNSRNAKIKQWDKEMSAETDKIEPPKETPPSAIARILENAAGEELTPTMIRGLGGHEYQYFINSVRKTGDKWVVREKNGREVTYKWTERALEWLENQ